MPDPRELEVNDRIRFVRLPAEWDDPGYSVTAESVELMEALIARRRPSRVCGVGDDGYPWIEVRLRRSDGGLDHHSWGIYESTGWVRVVRSPG